jgi:hypothetical protein
VSASVTRLRQAGALITVTDPADRRRTLVSPDPAVRRRHRLSGPDNGASPLRRKEPHMLRLLGIRPNRVLIGLAGIGALAAGLVVHHLVLIAIGGLLVVWAAVTHWSRRRGR